MKPTLSSKTRTSSSSSSSSSQQSHLKTRPSSLNGSLNNHLHVKPLVNIQHSAIPQPVPNINSREKRREKLKTTDSVLTSQLTGPVKITATSLVSNNSRFISQPDPLKRSGSKSSISSTNTSNYYADILSRLDNDNNIISSASSKKSKAKPKVTQDVSKSVLLDKNHPVVVRHPQADSYRVERSTLGYTESTLGKESQTTLNSSEGSMTTRTQPTAETRSITMALEKMAVELSSIVEKRHIQPSRPSQITSDNNTPVSSASSSRYNSAAESLDGSTPTSSVNELHYIAALPSGTHLPSNLTYLKKGSTTEQAVKKSLLQPNMTPTPPKSEPPRLLTRRASAIRSLVSPTVFSTKKSAPIPIATHSLTRQRTSPTSPVSAASGEEFVTPPSSSRQTSDTSLSFSPPDDRKTKYTPTDYQEEASSSRVLSAFKIKRKSSANVKSIHSFTTASDVHHEIKDILSYAPQKYKSYRLPNGIPRCKSTFINLGNTCFMNSVLQCVLASDELMAFFNSNAYRSDLNEKSKLKGLLAEGKQHDGQECLRMLLDGLHEDLNRVKSKPKFSYPESAEEQLKQVNNIIFNASSMGKAILAWNRYNMTYIFGGQFESIIQCDTCGYESPTYEPFWDLSLPIPQADSRNSVSLSNCLQEFGKKEKLEAEWNCLKCKAKRTATKSISIFRCPEILVIHLNRFRYDSYFVRKLSTHVDFALHNFSLASILSQRRKMAFGGSDENPLYDLYATVNHFGVANGGHYTAACKYEDGLWYTKDDATSRCTTQDSISGPSVYILFFRRQSKP